MIREIGKRALLKKRKLTSVRSLPNLLDAFLRLDRLERILPPGMPAGMPAGMSYKSFQISFQIDELPDYRCAFLALRMHQLQFLEI